MGNSSRITSFQEFPFKDLKGTCRIIAEIDGVVQKNGGLTKHLVKRWLSYMNLRETCTTFQI